MPAYTLLSSELRDFILAQGVPASAVQFLRDSEYVLPTARWVTGVFGPWFTADLAGKGYTYRPNSRDCEDFARRAAALACDCNAQTEIRAGNVPDEYGITPKPTYGLAFAEVWVKTPLHAINAAVHRLEGQLQLVAYEPQPTFGAGMRLSQVSLRVVHLTPDDWKLCKRFDI